MRLAALAQACQDIYDSTLPKPPKGAAEVPTRITRYEHLRRVVDSWTQATTAARERLIAYGAARKQYMDLLQGQADARQSISQSVRVNNPALKSVSQGPSRAGSKRATPSGVEPCDPPLTRDTAAYMRTPPPLYDHLFIQRGRR